MASNFRDSNFSSEDVSCTICSNQFDEREFVPKRLNCPHTLCVICVKQILKPNNSLRCPLCNKDQKVVPRDLATDLTTLRLIEVMKYFGVVEDFSAPRDDEPTETKPLMNVDDLPRELYIIEPSSDLPITGASKEVYCGKPIDYETRGLMKMRFKEGHMLRFQCIVDIAKIGNSLFILDTRFMRKDQKDTYIHVLQPSLDDGASVSEGFSLQGLETGCHGLTSINDHTLAITNNERHQVLIYTTKGELLTCFGTYGKGDRQFRDPRGIFYRNGRLYVTDCLNNDVTVWSVNGQFLNRIYEEEVIKYPMKIVLNHRGEMFIVCCNHYILVYSADGVYKTQITHAGEKKLEEIRCLHIDHCGYLLVAGKELERKRKSTWCIDVFDPALKFVRRIFDQQKKLKFISSLVTARTEGEDVIVVGDSGKGAVYFF